MNEDMSPRPRSFTDEELLNHVERHEKPFVTVSWLSNQIGVSSTAISQRLEKLEESDEIESKKVGASARVWWIPN